MRMRAVAVCGTSRSNPEQDRLAQELGRLIVDQGYALVCGGMGGIMAAACRGGQQARSAGAAGLVVGVLPTGGLDSGNPHCDLVIPTGLGYARNSLVVLAADVVVLVGGSAGTLSEAAYAWQFDKPIISLVPTGGWAAQLAGVTIDDRRDDAVLAAATPVEVLELIQGQLGGAQTAGD